MSMLTSQCNIHAARTFCAHAASCERRGDRRCRGATHRAPRTRAHNATPSSSDDRPQLPSHSGQSWHSICHIKHCPTQHASRVCHTTDVEPKTSMYIETHNATPPNKTIAIACARNAVRHSFITYILQRGPPAAVVDSVVSAVAPAPHAQTNVTSTINRAQGPRTPINHSTKTRHHQPHASTSFANHTLHRFTQSTRNRTKQRVHRAAAYKRITQLPPDTRLCVLAPWFNTNFARTL